MKIICSIGPNIKNENDLDKFINSGMTTMRLNFSHVDYKKAKTQINYIKNNFPKIDVIQDLQGNKLRVSSIFKGQFKVKTGDKVAFCSEDFYKKVPFTKEIIYVPIAIDINFNCLLSADKFLMKDSTMEFKIIKKSNNIIETEVVRGGIIRGEKGINAPGMDRSMTNLTVKDKTDIDFGLKNGVDIICLSYTSTAKNIVELKDYIKSKIEYKSNIKFPKIWAKIECKSGVNNFEEILEEVDGIMLGRGDLISEIDILDIPEIEAKFIQAMKNINKELIIATFILDSMKYSTHPSIAEVETLASFIKNKVNGVMLAGEVGVGKYPIKVIETTKKIIDKYKNTNI